MDRRLRQIAFLCLALGLSPLLGHAAVDAPPEPGRDARAKDRIAVLRALDKITARTVDLDVPIDQPTTFGTLTVTVRYCRKRPPEETPETFAFLEIDDHPPGRESSRVFTGWMVASSPALNPLEHPVYDLWVLDCHTPEGNDKENAEGG